MSDQTAAMPPTPPELPRGRLPALDDRDADRLFWQGVAHFNGARYWHAHEAWEALWRSAPDDERDFYQGLVHVAVAWYQAGRGNRVGCERQLAKAARRLGPFAPEHCGVDVGSVLAQVQAAAAIVAGGSLALPPVRI